MTKPAAFRPTTTVYRLQALIGDRVKMVYGTLNELRECAETSRALGIRCGQPGYVGTFYDVPDRYTNSRTR